MAINGKYNSFGMLADPRQIEIVTLFRDMFRSWEAESLLGKAVDRGLISLSYIDPRAFTTGAHRQVDDTPYGGGDGMVLQVAPYSRAVASATPGARRILLSPQGERVNQRMLARWANDPRPLVLVCGRYQGFDDRIRSYVDEEVSLGDFVINGGEVAAMAIVEGIARLLPTMIGSSGSLTDESHTDGLLECPQFTRPRTFDDQSVPDVLLSGDHNKIETWRAQQRRLRTRQRRPDLWRMFCRQREQLRSGLQRTYVALLHHPILGKSGDTISTAVTNLDVHDIARSARTFGLAGYFVVTPIGNQQQLVRKIVSHWETGHGASHNTLRRQALSLVRVVDDLDAVVDAIAEEHRQMPMLVATSAASSESGSDPVDDVHHALTMQRPVVILFGTGWGLASEVIDRADVMLPAIRGVGVYNHLSVRSAAAIVLDRLFSPHDGDAEDLLEK